MQNASDIVRNLSQFMASEGIPFDSVRSPSFQRFLSHVGVNPRIFHPPVLKNIAKNARTRRRIDENGPVSVTMNVTTAADGLSFLVFSVHFFEEFFERKHEIFFKKIDIDDLTPAMILEKLGRPELKISNFLCSKPKISEIFAVEDCTYTCFYEYVDEFASAILSEGCVKNAVNQIRIFLLKFQKALRVTPGLQRSRNKNRALPVLKNSTWKSISKFLNEWVVLHSSLDACESYYLGQEIGGSSNETFSLLRHIQKILNQCVASVEELSHPHSTISQVIPAVKRIEREVFDGQKKICRTVAVIRQTCVNVFKPLLSGPRSGKYEIAMLLDPRFAWNARIYPKDMWDRIQNFFMGQALLKTFTTAEMAFLGLDEQLDVDDRFAIFQHELNTYRDLIQPFGRYSQTQNPFSDIWRPFQSTLKFLSVMAREYLACPAIAIDAAYYFGERGGKFNRFQKRYEESEDDMEKLLNFASVDQEFRARGFAEDVALLEAQTPSQIQGLAPDPPSKTAAPLYRRRIRHRKVVEAQTSDQGPSTSSGVNVDESIVKEEEEDPEYARYEGATPSEPKRARLNHEEELPRTEEQKPEHLLDLLENPIKLEEVEESEEPEEPFSRILPTTSHQIPKPPKLADRYQISMMMDSDEEELDESEKIVLSDAWNVPEPSPPSPKPPKPYVKSDSRCSQCKQAGKVPKKTFKGAEDRLLVLMTAVLHQRMRLSDAIYLWPMPQRFYCATHVDETCRFLMNDVFAVERVDQILTVSVDAVEERVLEVLAAIQEVKMVKETLARQLKEIAHRFTYKFSNDFHCILCPRRFHRLQMFIVPTSAGNLSRWIKSGKIQNLDDDSEYRRLERLDLYKLFQAMNDRYLCKQHFHHPDRCTSAMGRLLAPERVLGEAVETGEYRVEEDTDEDEEEDQEEEEEEDEA